MAGATSPARQPARQAARQVATCAACGTPAPPPFRAPAPEGAPDLDLRPGEPTRSTLPRWVQCCRVCGACAPDLAALPPDAAALVRSDAYRAVAENAGAHDPAALPFLRWAFLAEAAGDRAAAVEAVLHAAWAVDDAGGDAAPLRRRAARLWGEPAEAEAALRLVDVLRRAGEWDAAEGRAAALAALPGLDDGTARILAFQRARIAGRDAGRHLISSALRPPATRPHVAHNQEAAPKQGRVQGRGQEREPGFWRRLFGG